ncbi:hypothetical protein CGRA01v4_01902 [Colletotrichum graminicola]|nr:hypothetical protein CGRA01v4_01902 [Colletotrichum graminicola]
MTAHTRSVGIYMYQRCCHPKALILKLITHNSESTCKYIRLNDLASHFLQILSLILQSLFILGTPHSQKWSASPFSLLSLLRLPLSLFLPTMPAPGTSARATAPSSSPEAASTTPTARPLAARTSVASASAQPRRRSSRMARRAATSSTLTRMRLSLRLRLRSRSRVSKLECRSFAETRAGLTGEILSGTGGAGLRIRKSSMSAR